MGILNMFRRRLKVSNKANRYKSNSKVYKNLSETIELENEEDDQYSNSKLWPVAFAFACVCSVLLVFGLHNFVDPNLKQDRNYIELNNALYKS